MRNKKKNNQRKISEKNRETLSFSNFNASKIFPDYLKGLNYFNNSRIVASFVSIKSEISTKFLNKFILENKKTLCLPVIVKQSETLIFREYNLKEKLISGKFGVMEPNDSNKELLPDIILTPCLAFDKYGFRLGYGGGYYDKTFTLLKNKKHKFISIAVAFDNQKVRKVVHDELDQKIDYILTEKQLYRAQ